MSSGGKNAVESELQDFLMVEKQRMQVTQQVREQLRMIALLLGQC